MSKYLSKSDFQLASSCPKKLVYKKAFYPTTNDTNDYMELLAQGGYVVGKMATLLYPEGIEIDGNTQTCIDLTNQYLQLEEVVLFEPAIVHEQKLIRVDILIKKKNHFHLIEVKAKSHNTEENRSQQEAKLRKYTEDVAYQYTVLKAAFPESTIKCSLFMPDKAKRTTIDQLAGWFSIKNKTVPTDREVEALRAQQKPIFNKPEIIFKYESHPNKEQYISRLRKEGILEYLDVTDLVVAMESEINQRADRFLHILNEGVSDNDYQISKNCKSCEFNTPDNPKNGFKECWGVLADHKHHIFDLNNGGSIGHHTSGFYFNELINEKKTSLFDVDLLRLRNSKGELSSRGIRQTIQINHTKSNTEWISPDLAGVISGFKYPLHFIDFETYTGAIPYHKNMRPYESIAFQWSCHTIKTPGATPVHTEWIHTGPMFPDAREFPNFEFAKSLMKQIGYSGTPFMWATHENTILKTILDQMDLFGYEDETLKQWLITTTSSKEREGRLIDMNQLTSQYYFHPYMKGKTSIKKVLPAVWSHHPYLHEVAHFKAYVPENFISGVIDPYDTLTTGTNGDESEDEAVSEGTAAMRAYHRIRFDDTLTEVQKEGLRLQLLQYCKLDTMAMVIIAHHWGLK
jgi:hypothetical protein